jgi:hypothetical protein
MTSNHITARDGRALVHADTGAPVAMSEVVTDFRGDTATVAGGYPPAAPGKSGYVVVRQPGVDGESMFYPSVFNLRWAG